MDLHLLRLALSTFVGQQLTPELASRIEYIATGNQDHALDPAQFEPHAIGDHVIAVERMSKILPELHALHQAHWLETEKHRHGFALDPDYQAMLADERAGRLIQFAVRELHGMELVGNLRMYLGLSRHTRTLFAQEDTLYLAAGHRRGFLAIHLLRYAERVLVEQLGVREIRADSKSINNAGALMRRLRYEAVGTNYVKTFPVKDASRCT